MQSKVLSMEKSTCVFRVLVPGTNFELLLLLAFSTGVIISGKNSNNFFLAVSTGTKCQKFDKKIKKNSKKHLRPHTKCQKKVFF